MAQPIGEVMNALYAGPQGLESEFAIALASEGPADRGDAAYDIVDRGEVLPNRLLVENVGCGNFVWLELQTGRQVRTESSELHVTRDAPGYEQEQHQRAFYLLNAGQLQRLHTAADQRRFGIRRGLAVGAQRQPDHSQLLVYRARLGTGTGCEPELDLALHRALGQRVKLLAA